METAFIGLTIKTIGEVIIGFSIISVHLRIMKEHKLDRLVYRSIRNEKFLGIVGIILIIVGYILETSLYI